MMTNPSIEVFYDGDCPLCRKEIGFYQRRAGAENVCWINLRTATQSDLPDGLSLQQALGRFHVRMRDGRLVQGGQAFAELWKVLPAFAWLGWLLRRPVFAPLTEAAYTFFLRHRPRIIRVLS